MAGTLNTPNPTDPIKANGFYSFAVTIPDDDVFSFTPKGVCGHVFLATTGIANHGQFWYRSSSVSKYAGATTTVAGTGVLTGTTGVDGNTTVSSSGGVLYIENRGGASIEYIVTLLCANDLYE
jgi:hypothetical protein